MGTPADALRARVYKGTRRADVYLFVASPDTLDELPPGLLETMGELTLVMEVDLYEGRPMAREDATTVMAGIRDHGFHLQLPPVDRPGSSRVQ